jgi:hypothetical protein
MMLKLRSIPIARPYHPMPSDATVVPRGRVLRGLCICVNQGTAALSGEGPMTDFYYSLPLWLATILVLGTALAIGLGSSLGLRAIFRLKTTEQETHIAITMMQVVAAYIGILLAFAGVEVWQDFQDAETAVHQEAATGSELYRDLTTYGPETQPIRNELRTYVATIVHDEWPMLQEGQGGSPKTEAALADLFEEFGKLRPKDERDGAIYSESFSKLNNLVVLRRNRLIDSQTGIPFILWMVGLVGSVLTVSYASSFARGRYNLMMIAGISLTMGLIFLFILTVDNPFKGKFSVSNAEMQQLSVVFDRLDKIDVTKPPGT